MIWRCFYWSLTLPLPSCFLPLVLSVLCHAHLDSLSCPCNFPTYLSHIIELSRFCKMTCYYPNDSAPWRGRDRRSTEKPRGLCVPVMLFSRKGKPASRNSSRRFFADRILTKPYADWVDGTFSRNFTGFGKERENVSAKRRLAQDNALPFSHRLSANFSQFFSQIAFPETLVFTGFRALFLTISQFLWRREKFFETDD